MRDDVYKNMKEKSKKKESMRATSSQSSKLTSIKKRKSELDNYFYEKITKQKTVLFSLFMILHLEEDSFSRE